MTTTTLTTYASDYAVGRQHVSFSIRSSTPTTGNMNDRDAQGQWRVVRGGTIIHRQNKVLDFQWLGLNGDKVYARAVDKAGNAGDWELYTYTVTANTAADWVRYVDTGGNDSTGDGSIGTPWATVTKAVTEAQTALTSGQVGVVFLSDDQSWAHTGTLMTGSDATSCLIRFVRRGNGTARPDLTFSANINGFTVGKRGVLHIDGVDITGSASTSGYAINAVRDGGVAADQDPWNLMIVDSTVSGFNYQVFVNNALTTGPGAADREDGPFDLIAFQNVEFSASNRYYLYGFFFTQHVLCRDCTFVAHTGAATNEFVRFFDLGRSMFVGCDADLTAASSTFRFLVKEAVGDDDIYSMREVTVANCSFTGASGSNRLRIGPDPTMANNGIARDVRFADCSFYDCAFEITASESGNNGVDSYRLDFLECWTVRARLITVSANATSANVHSGLRFRNCASASSTYAGGALITLNGTIANYAAGCLEVDGCWVWFASGNNEGRYFINANAISRADLASMTTSMDYNHAGKGDANSVNWTRTTEGNGTLATWQGATSFDDHSSVTLSTTFNLTDSGASVLLDADLRLASDSGPLAGTGYPLALGVSIDADGYLRSATTPDAGPFEYGASTLPDDPTISSGASSTRRRSALSLGLGLR